VTRPWFALEVTPSCTRSCLYCYNVWKAPGSVRPHALETREIAGLLARLSQDAQPSGITITGGEPLLRSDLEELSLQASRLFPAVALSTTGDGLTRERAARLVDSGMRHCEVALPSADPGTTADLCGMGSPGESSRAIAMLSGLGAFVTASILVCSRTVPGLRETVLLAAASGARAVCLNPFVPSGAGTGRTDLELSPEALGTAAGAASSAARKAGVPIYFGVAIRRCGVQASILEDCRSGPCVCGSGKWAVSPSGGLRPCEQSPLELGNLMEHGFRELRSGEAAEEFRSLPEGCLDCRSLPECGGGCRPARCPR
jgi:radical SAM protein with 4Fe4S-binding SPASM domain